MILHARGRHILQVDDKGAESIPVSNSSRRRNKSTVREDRFLTQSLMQKAHFPAISKSKVTRHFFHNLKSSLRERVTILRDHIPTRRPKEGNNVLVNRERDIHRLRDMIFFSSQKLVDHFDLRLRHNSKYQIRFVQCLDILVKHALEAVLEFHSILLTTSSQESHNIFVIQRQMPILRTGRMPILRDNKSRELQRNKDVP